MLVKYINNIESVQNKYLENKIETAKYLVSLWAHAARVSGAIWIKEQLLLEDMLQELFEEENIFHYYRERKGDIIDLIKDYFYHPIDIPSIIKYLSKNPEFAPMFYDNTCNVVVADGKVTRAEKKFLDYLMKHLHISETEKRIIHKKYLI